MKTDADILTTLEPRELPAVVLGDKNGQRIILARYRGLDNAVSLFVGTPERQNPAIWYRVGWRWCRVDPLALAACRREALVATGGGLGGPDVPDATGGIVGDSGAGPITEDTV